MAIFIIKNYWRAYVSESRTCNERGGGRRIRGCRHSLDIAVCGRHRRHHHQSLCAADAGRHHRAVARLFRTRCGSRGHGVAARLCRRPVFPGAAGRFDGKPPVGAAHAFIGLDHGRCCRLCADGLEPSDLPLPAGCGLFGHPDSCANRRCHGATRASWPGDRQCHERRDGRHIGIPPSGEPDCRFLGLEELLCHECRDACASGGRAGPASARTAGLWSAPAMEP